MSGSNIPPQHHFFYNTKWTAEMDARFLSTIVEQKNEGKWKSAKQSFGALLTAQGVVNAEFGCLLSWNDVTERIMLLESRYHTFRQILNVPETHWDRGDNCIITDDKVWKKIFKKNVFAKAYYYHGDPEFNKLAIVFGHAEIKNEIDHTVINISDSTLRIEEPEHVTLDVSDFEEVTSPMINDVAKLRRRLFDDDYQVVDRESTNNKGHYYVVDDEDGCPEFPLTNAFPPTSKEIRFSSKETTSSSCASSSPSKWWKNPFK